MARQDARNSLVAVSFFYSCFVRSLFLDTLKVLNAVLIYPGFFNPPRTRHAICGWIDRRVNEFVFCFFQV